MATKIVMAQLSPTMEEGKLLEWKVAEGDTIEASDLLAEIDFGTVTLAAARPIFLRPAATAITLLVLSNTFSKMVLAITLGGRRSGSILMLPLVVPLLLSAIVLSATIV